MLDKCPTVFPEPTVDEPSIEQLTEWSIRAFLGSADSFCETTDGCVVEPDGWCEHGHVSWFVYKGYI